MTEPDPTLVTTITAQKIRRTFGARLSAALERSGMTQTEYARRVAERLGASPESTRRRITRYRGGRATPQNAEALVAICEPLGIHPSELYSR